MPPYQYLDHIGDRAVLPLRRLAQGLLDRRCLTVTVPIRIKRRGLRKTVTLPDGGSLHYRPWDSSPTPLQLALARGHRLLAMLESSETTSMKEIAWRERVDDSYVSRMVNLITLAPDIVTAILDEALPSEVTLFELTPGTRLLLKEQRGRVWLD